MVNPTVKYSPKGSPSPERAVAIVLREFFKALESQHCSEKQLRKLLRKQPRCATSKKQFFLDKKSKSNQKRDRHVVSLASVYLETLFQKSFEIVRG